MKISQLVVIESHEAENGRVHISNRNRFVDRAQTEFIGFPGGCAPFDIAAGHPHRQRVRVVLATGMLAKATVLEGCASHFRGPDDKRVLE